ELLKHPEGGYYKEVYRSNELINKNHLADRFTGDRCYCTSIYFLLNKNDFSAFHRIKSDETWHFYSGTSLSIYIIDEQTGLTRITLGNQLDEDNVLQYTIQRNTWFAAELNHENSFALVGCSVYPGFDFNDFELAKKENLITQMPEHRTIIEKLCIQ
ncbi:MAG: cupin domain-containing protein, partial [Candidatus Omnitrophica bacterium]|nr:cupin domain-containing protein [Candidatus Omnitrophota bacterium]